MSSIDQTNCTIVESAFSIVPPMAVLDRTGTQLIAFSSV